MFRCKECDKEFAKEGGLKLHVHRMHTAAGESWGRGKGRPWSAKRRAAAARKSELQPELDLRDKEIKPVRSINYCPQCGYHLAPLGLLLKLTLDK